jgi:hypothetical protein
MGGSSRLLWHIYPQEDDAHWAKLEAFVARDGRRSTGMPTQSGVKRCGRGISGAASRVRYGVGLSGIERAGTGHS